MCRKRIKGIKHLQDKQFKYEIKNLEAMQQTAYDQIRFHRFAELFLSHHDTVQLLPSLFTLLL